MGTPAEFLYESCTCVSGMRDGQRCADCGGRGIISKGTKPTGKAVKSDEEAALQTDDLDNLSMTDLRGLARDNGVSAGGGRKALTDRIRAAAQGEAAAEDGAHTASDGEEAADADEETEPEA